MMMDIGGICLQYKYAKDKKKCVSILADLNSCSTERILSILQSGEEGKKGIRKTRLIDADNFMKFMDALEEAGAEHVSFYDLRKFIENQPAAYGQESLKHSLVYGAAGEKGNEETNAGCVDGDSAEKNGYKKQVMDRFMKRN